MIYFDDDEYLSDDELKAALHDPRAHVVYANGQYSITYDRDSPDEPVDLLDQHDLCTIQDIYCALREFCERQALNLLDCSSLANFEEFLMNQ